MGTRLEQRRIALTASTTLRYPFHQPGLLFTNRGASGAVVVTLPTANDAVRGVWYDFRLHADQSFTVAAPSANTLVCPGDATADSAGFLTTSKKVGRGFRAVCDGTSWYAFPLGALDGFSVDGVELSSSLGAGTVLTTPVIDGVTYSALNDRQVITEAFAVSGAALHAAILPAVTFPAAAIILRAILDITTVATGACTIDVGYTAVSGTTSSDTLLDGVDANAAIATFDSMNALLDSGANALAQKAASGKWVTIDEKTGDSTGMVAVLYVQYILA